MARAGLGARRRHGGSGSEPFNSDSALRALGWRGKGHALRDGGLRNPILTSRKHDTAGLGTREDAAAQWWDSAFSAQLAAIDVQIGSKRVAAAAPTVAKGSHSATADNVEAQARQRYEQHRVSMTPLYRFFVLGGLLQGTLPRPLCDGGGERRERPPGETAKGLDSETDNGRARKRKREEKREKALKREKTEKTEWDAKALTKEERRDTALKEKKGDKALKKEKEKGKALKKEKKRDKALKEKKRDKALKEEKKRDKALKEKKRDKALKEEKKRDKAPKKEKEREKGKKTATGKEKTGEGRTECHIGG